MADKNVHEMDSIELRILAEKQLRDETALEPPLGTEDDPRKLLHELQAHQIELEMQNAELSQTKVRLETALEQYTDLYDFAPVSYLTLDRVGTINKVNLTATGLVGVDRSRLIGMHFGLLVTDSMRPAFADFFERVFASLAKETCEVALLKEGNSPFFVHIEAVTALSGQECRFALFDLTERKLVRKMIREAEGVAKEILEKAVELALHLMEESKVEAFRVIEGISESPQKVEKIKVVARRRVENAAEEARRRVEDAAEVARRRVEDAANILPLDEEETKKALQLVKEATDIARLKVESSAELARRAVLLEAANETLRHEKEVAEAATQSKSQFLANMSHELRTPMTGVLGMLDLLLLGNLEVEQREFVNAAHTSARSLVRILNDILDMTKIEMGILSIVEKPFSLRKCVEHTFNILQPVAINKGINLNFTVADDVAEILVGDETRLNQILTNLAGNAVKFTNKGRVEISVAAGDILLCGKREVTFTVTDTGIGVPAAKKALLFRNFSQVDESHSREYGGAGLGLAISQRIVELMGGIISFTSDEGKGSTFTFTIPFVVGQEELNADFAPWKTATTDDASRAEETNKARLLVAEDDDTCRQVLGRMLQMFKYEVDLAENGQTVVEMWKNGQYDLILMDVQMPLMNGFVATAAIRDIERSRGGRNIPIVAMTAHALKKDEKKCLDVGMDAYISKPIDFARTLQMIREILKQ